LIQRASIKLRGLHKPQAKAIEKLLGQMFPVEVVETRTEMGNLSSKRITEGLLQRLGSPCSRSRVRWRFQAPASASSPTSLIEIVPTGALAGELRNACATLTGRRIAMYLIALNCLP
jgi:hypothetical protein